MKKSIFRRALNRVLQLIARFSPGSESLRPFLHRLRGMKIGEGVFIGDDVYLDNEYPECVEIHANASISMRAVVIAHTRGAGRVILEKDSFVGPNAIICCSAGRVLTVGEGAVVAAGAVITHSVPPRTMVGPPPSKPIAKLKVPLTSQTSMQEFLAGLTPLSRPVPGASKQTLPSVR